MWSRSLCLCAAALMIFLFCIGCEEEVVEKKAEPTAEKAEVKAPEAKPEEPKAEAKPAEVKLEVKPAEPKVEAKPAAPEKTEVTVAKVAPPEAPKAAAPPAAAVTPAEPEQKVAAPKPPAPPAVGPYKAEDTVWVVDDFELGNNFWQVETWANPAKLSIADGELKIELGEGKQDKSAIGRVASLDMSDRSKLLLDVRNNAQKNVKLAVAFMTGGASTYFESEMAAAKPGLTKNLAIDLRAEKFKCLATNWEHKTRPAEANAVKRVCILVYGENKAEVCLDNIRFEK